MRYLKTIIGRIESFITPEVFADSDTTDRLTDEDKAFENWIRIVLSRLDQMEREDNE